MVAINIDNKSFYVDNWLYEQLKKIKHSINNKDKDHICIVDGEERSGKSVLSQQLCKAVDPTFNEDRMCQSVDEFLEKGEKCTKGQAICFDEAFCGLGSRSTMTEDNRRVVDFLKRAGQKNLFIVLTIQTIYMMDLYAVIWRAKELFHVYERKDGIRYWLYFNRPTLRYLWSYGKSHKDYTYRFPKADRYGRFLNQYVIDEVKYRQAKDKTTVVGKKDSPTNKYLKQRNVLLYYLNKELNIPQETIANKLKEHGIDLERTSIGMAIDNVT